MSLATITMTKPASENAPSGQPHCTYTSLKVDDELMPEIKAAAAFDRLSVQELVSNILNDYTAKRFKHAKINRRPPPPRDKRKPANP